MLKQSPDRCSATGASKLYRISGLALVGIGLACLPACSDSIRAVAESSRSQNAQTPATVRVIIAGRKDLIRKTTLLGTLVALNEATLYGKIAGYLKSISVDKGDRVRHGQTLAVLDVPEMLKELDQAQALYQEAVANLSRSKAEAELRATTYRRYSEVHSKDPDAISNQELDEYRNKFELAQTDVKLAEAKVATARANHERLMALHRYASLTAPFSGIVTARFVDPGALIQAAASSMQAQPIVSIQNLDTIRVYVSVPEAEVPFIRGGSAARLTPSAYPQKVFQASVTRFAEALDPATRTMKTEIDIANPGHLLRPGMYADVTLDLEKRAGALVVPDSALIVEGSRKFVYVVGNGTAHRVAVETGLDDGAEAEILSGLRGGEQVVVAGKENLAEGKRVEASPLTSATS